MSSKFDGYQVELRFDEDEEWLAYLLEMPTVSAFGETPEEALQQLAEAFELVKEVYAEEGKHMPDCLALRKYSGQFNVRIDKRLHRELALEAARAGVSLNALVAQKLMRQVELPGIEVMHPAHRNQASPDGAGNVSAQAGRATVVRLRPSESTSAPREYRLAAAHQAGVANDEVVEKEKAKHFDVDGRRFKVYPASSGSVLLQGPFDPTWTHLTLAGRRYPLAAVARQPETRRCEHLSFGDLIIALGKARREGGGPLFVSVSR